MSHGPGKYDDECTAARYATGASAIILIVKDGIRGSGFSAQFTSPTDMADIVTTLRSVIRQIEGDLDIE